MPLYVKYTQSKILSLYLLHYSILIYYLQQYKLIIGSDDPNGIEVSVPAGTNNHHTKKVLTPEMVNLGIKVEASQFYLLRLQYPTLGSICVTG